MVSCDAEKLAVTLIEMGCCKILRTCPSPDPVVLTPAVKVSVEAEATVSAPDQEPPVVGKVPPNLEVTTTGSPLVKPCAGTVSTPGEADVQEKGIHL